MKKKLNISSRKMLSKTRRTLQVHRSTATGTGTSSPDSIHLHGRCVGHVISQCAIIRTLLIPNHPSLRGRGQNAIHAIASLGIS